MKYLHFIHYNKNWFYQFNDFADNKSWNHPGRDLNGNWTWYSKVPSKAQALKELKEKFPNEEPIFNIAYHEGRKSSYRNSKNGSRPYKPYSLKDDYRLNERRYRQRRKREEDNI